MSDSKKAKLKFDGKDAVMGHQTMSGRAFTTSMNLLLREYFQVCQRFGDSKVAREVHQQFIHALEASRALLTTQSKQTATSLQGASTVIIRNEWGKEFFKKVRMGWNSHGHELNQQAIEASVNWLLSRESTPDWSSYHMISPGTCYCEHLGLILQKWADKKDAKNFVNSFHAALNAPLSKIFAPYATTFEILGVTIVAMTLAPVEKEWENWREVPIANHHYSAVCATLRFIRVSHATQGVVKDVDVDTKQFTRLKFALGSDGRIYGLDLRDLSSRGTILSDEVFVKRCPRRELLFSASGVCSAPYSPHEFIHRFKLKSIVEQLINGYLTENPSNTVLGLMHLHGVPFGPYIFQLYYTISDQERVFNQSLQTGNRKETVMTPHATQKLARYRACKTALLSELFAHVLKRVIRSEWDRTLKSEGFLAELRAFIQMEEDDALEEDEEDEEEEDEEEEDDEDSDGSLGERPKRRKKQGVIPGIPDDSALSASSRQQKSEEKKQRVESLNKPFLESVNSIVHATFGTVEAQSTSGHKSSRKHVLVLREAMFKECMFILNDMYVKKVVGDKVDAKFEAKVEDFDLPKIVGVLAETLGLPVMIQARTHKVLVEPGCNIFATFFDLESGVSCAVRSNATQTTIELPICLVAGARSKMVDFVNLQQRIAAKIVASVSPTLSKDSLMYHLETAKFVLLYAGDVTVAHRGTVLETDFEDVLSQRLGVAYAPSPWASKLFSVFENQIVLRRANLFSSTDLGQALKLLVKFGEKARSLFDTSEGTGLVIAEKINTLCRICEHFSSPTLIAALEAVIDDLTALTTPPTNTYNKKTGGRDNRTAELRVLHSAHLFLNPLSLLVRHVLQPDTTRSQAESLAIAVKNCTKRRDIIKEVYGEISVETGVACNDIAVICSNNKYDFEIAEAEFERAVLVLSEAQPEGPTVFVAMNNLAFLYFRKAEKIRKTPKPPVEGGLSKLQQVDEWVSKADKLLEDVLSAQQSMNVLDYAAALNNMASIRMFESKLKEAERYFTKTLQVTEHLQKEGAPEIAPRAHAIRNLKIVARKQYVSTVLRIQGLVRKFLNKLKNAKNVRQVKAIMPLQRISRAYQTRLFCAKHYRFSAWHSWLRKPEIYHARLDHTYAMLPDSVKKDAWDHMKESSTKRLQRVFKGQQPRLCLGQIFNFANAFFVHRVPMVVQEIDRRRSNMFSVESQSWMHAFGCEYLGSLIELQIKAHNYEYYVRVEEIKKWERRLWFDIHEEEEAHHRITIDLENRSEWRWMLRSSCLLELEVAEITARQISASSELLEMRKSVSDHILWPQFLHSSVTNVQHVMEIDYVIFLEVQTRKNIESELVTILKGEKFLHHVPRAGRAFLTRQLLGSCRKLFVREQFQRVLITAEESGVMSFANLQTDWRIASLFSDEAMRRDELERTSLRYLEYRTDEMNDIGAAEVVEVHPRFNIFAKEKGEFLRDIIHDSQRHRLTTVDEVNLRQEIATQAVVQFIQILQLQETDQFATIHDMGTAEFRTALQASLLFAIAVLEKQQDRARWEIRVEEGSVAASDIYYPAEAITSFFVQEQRTWRSLLIQMEDTIEAQNKKEYVTRKHEFESREMQQQEDKARKVITAAHYDQLVQWKLEMNHRECNNVEFQAALRSHKDRVQEYDLRSGLCFVGHAHIWFCVSALQLNQAQEEVHRYSILEQREWVRVTELRDPIVTSLASIRDLEEKSEERGRHLFVSEEERESCYNEAYCTFLIEFSVFASDPMYDELHQQQVHSFESRERLALYREWNQHIRDVHCEQPCVEQRTMEFRNAFMTINSFLVAGITAEESLFRSCGNQTTKGARLVGVEVEQCEEWPMLKTYHTEFCERQLLQREAETSMTSIFMLSLHSYTMSKVLLPMFFKGYTEITSDQKRRARFIAAGQMIGRLHKTGRGFLLRKRFGVYANQQSGALAKLQRIGRGFYTRRRFSVYFAELIEHCLFFATEAQTRVELHEEESKARQKLGRYHGFHGPRFLMARGSGSKSGNSNYFGATNSSYGLSSDSAAGANSPSSGAESPFSAVAGSTSYENIPQKRKASATTHRLFTAPEWQSSGLFYAGKSQATPPPFRTTSEAALLHAARVAASEEAKMQRQLDAHVLGSSQNPLSGRPNSGRKTRSQSNVGQEWRSSSQRSTRAPTAPPGRPQTARKPPAEGKLEK